MTFIRQAEPFGLFDKMDVIFLHGDSSITFPMGMAMPEGIYVGTNYDFAFLDTATNREFIDLHYEVHGVPPTGYTALGWVGMQFLLEAIEQAGTVEKYAVMDVLSGMTLETPVGVVTIRELDNQGDMGLFFARTFRHPDYPRWLMLEKLDHISGPEILIPEEWVRAIRARDMTLADIGIPGWAPT
jgi:hypothetical protein